MLSHPDEATYLNRVCLYRLACQLYLMNGQWHTLLFVREYEAVLKHMTLKNRFYFWDYYTSNWVQFMISSTFWSVSPCSQYETCLSDKLEVTWWIRHLDGWAGAKGRQIIFFIFLGKLIFCSFLDYWIVNKIPGKLLKGSFRRTTENNFKITYNNRDDQCSIGEQSSLPCVSNISPMKFW